MIFFFVLIFSTLKTIKVLSPLFCLLLPGGHSGEVIPVPIPNTEVKLSYADDTADQVGK